MEYYSGDVGKWFKLRRIIENSNILDADKKNIIYFVEELADNSSKMSGLLSGIGDIFNKVEPLIKKQDGNNN